MMIMFSGVAFLSAFYDIHHIYHNPTCKMYNALFFICGLKSKYWLCSCNRCFTSNSNVHTMPLYGMCNVLSKIILDTPRPTTIMTVAHWGGWRVTHAFLLFPRHNLSWPLIVVPSSEFKLMISPNPIVLHGSTSIYF